MLLRTSQTLKTGKQVHSYSAPALCSPDTSEARVGEQAVRLKTKMLSARTSSQMSPEHLQYFALIKAQACQHAQTCHKQLKFQAKGSRAHKRKPNFVKTRSNSFHSTLEPNTEVFSKVSRSLAQFTLVNSFSTLLNKGGITCNCPNASQDFSKTENKQASAQLLCSSLALSRHERSEGRRTSC